MMLVLAHDRRKIVQVGPGAVIVINVRREHLAQMALVEYGQVIQAFSPDRADDSFEVCILPW